MELAVLVLIAFAVAVVYLRDGKSSAPTRD
jgi:hypothetical protein